MEKYSDQVKSICSWIKMDAKWTKIRKDSGESTPGSLGENTIIGYLPSSNGNENEITIIYKCRLPLFEDSDVADYQLSSLAYTDWVKFMKKIND
ncbi:hypothetical protein [Leclercia adecarboxylata]|uniref:hypothetical protein n=1 Tax=Leclercia adecarboxylata TaxID=83655 RepID=UPI00254E13C0|nr:hypothetical protein [Leclercia adecarboxylata]